MVGVSQPQVVPARAAALDLFAGVPASRLERLLAGLPTLPVAAGDAWVGDGAWACAVIVAGRVALDFETSDARMRTIGLLEEGDLLVHGDGVPGRRGPAISARAIEDSVLMPVGHERLALWSADPDLGGSLARALLAQVADRELAAAIALEPTVERRLLLKLRQLADRWGSVTADGVRLDLRLTHQELAELVGAVRESVTIALGSLMDQGELDVRRRTILLRPAPGDPAAPGSGGDGD